MKATLKPSEHMSNYVQSLLQGHVQTDELVSQKKMNSNLKAKLVTFFC